MGIKLLLAGINSQQKVTIIEILKKILTNGNNNPLRWVHESFYYFQQPETCLSFFYTLQLIVEFEYVSMGFP